MSTFSSEIIDLMAIKKPCIQVRTNLEKEVFPALLNILYSNDIDVVYRINEIDRVEKITVSNTGKIVRTPVEGDFGPLQFNPNMLLTFVRDIINNENNKETSAFLFMDYDSKFDNSAFRRWIKDIFELRNERYAPFIFISSEPSVPDDLNHLFSVVYYDTPTVDEIKQLLNDYIYVKEVEIKDIDNLAHKFIGFNRTEIIECLDYSFHKYNEIDDSYIRTKRIEVIKKSNVLEYKEPKLTFEDWGGNHYFKEWYNETKYAFEPDAKDYGVPMPKGFMATGPAGTSKSMSAEMIAADLNIPLISLDLSAILSKYVGDSERNIDQAIQTINQIAPCVLLIDECEKALAGKQI